MYIGSILTCSDLPENLDSIIKKENYKTLNIYIDLKNAAKGLYVKDIVEEIINNTQEMKSRIDSRIFQSLIFTASKWIVYSKLRNLNYNIIFCTDIGKSIYHMNISDKYKENRIITNSSLGDLAEPLIDIRNKNFDIGEKVLNKIPNIYFFNLKFLESDFLPYYLITRKFNNPNTLSIICSNDKDHYQILNIPNTIMYTRTSKEKKLFNKDGIISEFVKLHKNKPFTQARKLNEFSNIDSKYITIMMAICGDKIDCVEGIDGIGPVKSCRLFTESSLVKDLIGDNMEDVRNRINKGGKLFLESNIDKINDGTIWKNVVEHNELLTKSFRLIDYEMLIKFLEKKDTTEKIDMLEYIERIINKDETKKITKKVLWKYIKDLPDKSINENVIEGVF